jgi:hypothetical protein
MENCTELKQTTIKKTINFPKCSIEFELRGATEKEFNKNSEIVNKILNEPKLLALQLKAEAARVSNDYAKFTKKDNEDLTKYNERINEASSKSSRDLLMTCLTPNPLYNAGFEVKKGGLSFENVTDVFDIMTKVDVEELEKLALTLSTIGASEVAEEQVKQV